MFWHPKLRLPRPRFGLRALFLVTAAAAVFCAYHVRWISDRHQLIRTEHARYDDFVNLKALRGTALTLHAYIDNPKRPPPGNLLWLFGEKQHTDISVYVYLFPEDDASVEQRELTAARGLFPESQLLVWTYRWGPIKQPGPKVASD